MTDPEKKFSGRYRLPTLGGLKGDLGGTGRTWEVDFVTSHEEIRYEVGRLGCIFLPKPPGACFVKDITMRNP